MILAGILLYTFLHPAQAAHVLIELEEDSNNILIELEEGSNTSSVHRGNIIELRRRMTP